MSLCDCALVSSVGVEGLLDTDLVVLCHSWLICRVSMRRLLSCNYVGLGQHWRVRSV